MTAAERISSGSLDRRSFCITVTATAISLTLPSSHVVATPYDARPWPLGEFFTGMTNYGPRPTGYVEICFSDGAWVADCDFRSVDVWLDGVLHARGDCIFERVRGPGRIERQP